MNNKSNENYHDKLAQVVLNDLNSPIQEKQTSCKQKFRQNNRLKINLREKKLCRNDDISRPQNEQSERELMNCLQSSVLCHDYQEPVLDGSDGNHAFRNRKITEKYELIECLGNGANGKVYKMRHRTNQKYYAAKVVVTYDDENIQHVMNEFQILSQLENEYIVKAEEVFENGRSNEIVIILEFVEGQTLDEYIKDKHSSIDTIQILSQLLEALEYLHSQEVIHRDIQNSNIMVDCDGKIKLIDFGVAKKVQNQQDLELNDNCFSAIFTPTGIIEMRAPEIQEFYGYTFKSDIWQLGLVSLELLTCKKVSTQRLLRKVKQSMLDLSYENALSQMMDKYQVQPIYKKFLISCLQKDPERRPNTQQLKQMVCQN